MTSKPSTSNHGGKRIRAGRKPWAPFREPTKAIRIPVSHESVILNYLDAVKRRQHDPSIDNIGLIQQPSLSLSTQKLPLYSSSVRAGFPSPADDHVEQRLDLNEYLIKQADATFFVRIKGDSMMDVGIHDKDVVIVDKSQTPAIGDIVLAAVDGDFTVKILAKDKQGSPRLLPANTNYSPIEIKEGMLFEIWGVVTGSVRKFK